MSASSVRGMEFVSLLVAGERTGTEPCQTGSQDTLGACFALGRKRVPTHDFHGSPSWHERMEQVCQRGDVSCVPECAVLLYLLDPGVTDDRYVTADVFIDPSSDLPVVIFERDFQIYLSWPNSLIHSRCAEKACPITNVMIVIGGSLDSLAQTALLSGLHGA